MIINDRMPFKFYACNTIRQVERAAERNDFNVVGACMTLLVLAKDGKLPDVAQPTAGDLADPIGKMLLEELEKWRPTLADRGFLAAAEIWRLGKKVVII